jgi:hypothetical protein
VGRLAGARVRRESYGVPDQDGVGYGLGRATDGCSGLAVPGNPSALRRLACVTGGHDGSATLPVSGGSRVLVLTPVLTPR